MGEGFNLQVWLAEHPLITYLFMVVSMIYIFNAVFRPRKLPLLKDLLVYALILLGGLLLLFFQNRVGLPIVHGFAVAIALMLIVRIRSWMSRRRSGGASQTSSGVTANTVDPEAKVRVVTREEQAGDRR